MNIFAIREGKRPIWPTFRAGVYSEEVKLRLQAMPNLMYFGEGSHPVHLLPNGGFGRHGHPDSIQCPVLSWEQEFYCTNNERKRKTKIYLLAWLGFYPPGKEGGRGGSILHVGWQYPHASVFDFGELQQCAFMHYKSVAAAVYGTQPYDSDVQRFVSQGA